MQAFTKRFAALLTTAVVVAGLTACSGTKRPKPADLGPNPVAIGVRRHGLLRSDPSPFPLSARVVDNLVYRQFRRRCRLPLMPVQGGDFGAATWA